MKYFKLSEFDCPTEKGTGKKMSRKLLSMLDNAREHSGTPFIITSGYRTKKHNDSLEKSSKNSSHLKGLAIDIACDSSVERLKIVKGLIKAGFRRIGIAKTFIHADIDKDKTKCIWVY